MGTKGKREEKTDGLKPKGIQRLRELREENTDLRIKLGELERELEKEHIEHQVDSILWDYASGTPALPVKEEAEPPAAPHGGHRAAPQNSRAHGFAHIMGNLMFYLAIVLLLAGAVMIRSTRSGAPVSIAGYSGLVVLSESMQDVIPKGSFILTRHVEPETLQIGDDITFMTNSVTCVTHRIVDIRPQPDGTLAFQTKGVNNQTPDSNLAAAGNVVGKVVYHNLLLGQIAQWISANWPLVVFLLAVWAALSWVLKRTMRPTAKEGGRRLQKRNSAPAEPAGTARNR
ncbi:Signal peptidase I W [uncultured Flavonifractor sp.]|nr:signal peptidase type I [Flavonifractor plautii]SCJ54073.1 Signal peptidase I W [uncultured Flavonifractor sp.]